MPPTGDVVSACDESIAQARRVLQAAPRRELFGRAFERPAVPVADRGLYVWAGPLRSRGATSGRHFWHCKRCQRRSGSAFSVTAAMVPDRFASSTEPIYSRRGCQSMDGRRTYCRECGSHIHTTNPDQPGHASIRMGALDSDPGVRPTLHQFTTYAASWLPIPDDGLPCFPERMPAGLRPPEVDA
jgi:hypothetical protein